MLHFTRVVLTPFQHSSPLSLLHARPYKCSLYSSSSHEPSYFLSTHLSHICIRPSTTVMSGSQADVAAAAAPHGRRSRRRDRRNRGSNVSAGTEQNATSGDDLKLGGVIRNASMKNKSNCELCFSFP